MRSASLDRTAHVPSGHEHRDGRDYLVCKKCGCVYAVPPEEVAAYLASLRADNSALSLFGDAA